MLSPKALCLTTIVLLAAVPCSAQDLVVSGETLVIDSPRTVDGEVIVEDGGTLVIRDTELTLQLDFDEEHHIDFAGGSKLVVENAKISSTGGQYWIELYAVDGVSPTMEVTGDDSWITNHSGIRPFDDTTITVTGGDVEELQVRDRTVVALSNAATYPVFFFDGINADIPRLDTGESITNTITTAGGWSFSLTDANVEGYQIDLMNGARVSLADGDGIVLSMHTPGDLGDELRVVEGATGPDPLSGSVTSIGTEFHFTNSNIALINVYVFGNDRVLLRNLHVNEVNAEASSELVIGQKGIPTRLNCNLCQVYDDATFTVVDATIDGSDNLPSATASYADFSAVGRGVMSFANMDLRELDLAALDHGTLNLYNCTVDDERLSILDETATVNRGTLRSDFTATRLSGKAPLSVGFLDLSAGQITSWSWDFGDGSTSAQQFPTHVYTRAGTFEVELTVTGAGASHTRTRSAYVTVSGETVRRRPVRR
jgi:hypothetical protein